MKTYQGSCHCGAIRFQAHIDLATGTMRCNCSFCLKIRCWAIAVQPARFTLLAGAADLTLYQFGAHKERHYFCKQCGVRPFGRGNSARLGDFYSVSVACLDSCTQDELAGVPITYVDGRNDEWAVAPAQTGFL